MSIQKIVNYRTSDGTLFTTREEALAHELSKAQYQAMKEFLINNWPDDDLQGELDIWQIGEQLLLPNLQALKAVCDITPTVED